MAYMKTELNDHLRYIAVEILHADTKYTRHGISNEYILDCALSQLKRQAEVFGVPIKARDINKKFIKKALDEYRSNSNL